MATGEQLTAFLNDLNRRIFELVHSPSHDDRIGGILAIGAPTFARH
jgi:FKBP12-rapamycin complex-associated protein